MSRKPMKKERLGIGDAVANDAQGQETAKLSFPGGEAELPILPASEGRGSLDISKLTAQSGLTALDYGFVNTASAKSEVTFIDGDEGILRYRGYPIEELAQHSTFLEVAYLLIYGDIPTPTQLEEFDIRIRRHTLLHEDMSYYFEGLPHTAHPMAALSGGLQVLSTYYEDSLDTSVEEFVEVNTIRLLAKLPIVAAYAHKKSIGQAFLYPNNEHSFVENFLRLNFGTKAEEYEINPVLVDALDKLLILHADHEQNASTSTVRLVGSTGANMFSSVSAGISALSGPLHGGANEAVLKMLGEIQESGDSVKSFVERVKNKEKGVKLMGFGHRVYKNYDPRARIVKDSASRVLAELGVNDPLLDLAQELEQIALNDPYFQERRLYPNVDFYTGVIYKAMGFPTRMFTVLFAIGRLPGWIAHWREARLDPQTKIGRPQQLYTGSGRRKLDR